MAGIRTFAQMCFPPWVGDTVHGKVDAYRAQQEEELNEVRRKARTNPWHLCGYGLLHGVDRQGHKMYSTYDDPLVKTTPWDSLQEATRKLLGENYDWASWMMHPLSGYGLQFFLKAVELGKLQGNYLVEFVQKPARYTGGYLSPYERYKSRHPNELAGTLNDLTYAEGREFAPRVSEIGFRRPAEEIDDPDYVEKLARYTAFLKESGCKPRDQVCSGRLSAPHQCHLRCVWSGFL